MIETPQPMTARPDPTDPPETDLVQTAREAGAAAKERLSDTRDAALSSLDEAKSAAAEKVEEAKEQAVSEDRPHSPRTRGGSRRRWTGRLCSRICFARQPRG